MIVLLAIYAMFYDCVQFSAWGPGILEMYSGFCLLNGTGIDYVDLKAPLFSLGFELYRIVQECVARIKVG